MADPPFSRHEDENSAIENENLHHRRQQQNGDAMHADILARF
jgi:hypothetical protein